MGLDPISAGIDFVTEILKKWIPDANEREKAAAAIREQVHQELMGQIDINKVEAANTNLFVAGWRPMIGWSCGLAFIYSSIGVPMLTWLCSVNHLTPPPPVDTSVMVNVLGAMLGIATLRTVDKYNGKA